jgi:hypothetical protein
MVKKDEKDPSDKDVTFLDLFNPLQPRSPEDLMEERMAICRECSLPQVWMFYVIKNNTQTG